MAKTITRSVDDFNGWEAYRRIHKYYIPDVGDRHVSVLQGLLNPSYWAKVPVQRFWAAFMQWENAVAKYERDARDMVTPVTRVAVVKKHAPAEVRSALCLADVGKDYVKC